MSHRAEQRVAGLHLLQHTAPYRATAGDASLDVAMVAPAVRRRLAEVYAAPLPAVAVRAPLERRRTRLGRALAWCWRKRADAAALTIAGLAVWGAYLLMDALLRAGGI